MTVAPDGPALLASGLWGTSDFLRGSLSRRIRTLHVLSGSQLTAALLVVIAAVATGADDITGTWPAASSKGTSTPPGHGTPPAGCSRLPCSAARSPIQPSRPLTG